jgi:hypothetical protein
LWTDHLGVYRTWKTTVATIIIINRCHVLLKNNKGNRKKRQFKKKRKTPYTEAIIILVFQLSEIMTFSNRYRRYLYTRHYTHNLHKPIFMNREQ